jgi:class 3 adenylate cyclase
MATPTGPQRRIIMFEDNGDGTMVPAGDAAGPKYRVVSSVGRGDTLDVPMRIRDDDERTAEGAPPSITATKYPEVTLDDINTKPAHDDMDGDDHDTSTDRDNQSFGRGSSTNTTSTANSTNSTGTSSTLMLCGFKLKIPFTVWTLVAMMVPIILVSIFTGMQLSTAVVEMRNSNSNTDLAVAVTSCATQFIQERGMSGEYLTTRSAASKAKLDAQRLTAEHVCRQGLDDVYRKRQTWDAWMKAEEERQTNRLMLLSGFRSRVDSFEVSLETMALFYTTLVKNVTKSLNHGAGMVTLNSYVFYNIVAMVDMRNVLGMTRAVAYPITLSPPTDEATWASKEMMLYGAAKQGEAVVGMVQLVTGSRLQAKVQHWFEDGLGVVLFARIHAIQAAVAARDAVSVAAMSQVLWDEMTAALLALNDIEKEHVQAIGAKEAEASQRDAIIFLVVGVVACLVAGALLAWKQLQVKGQLEKQVENIARTRKAVQAFVPRFFLRKMGYTSILQVKCGESTDVAVAMLFSDIRHFTTVSEGMTSSKLFDWIQGYFKRVTTIVEQRHGNVNQFIGDALFAIFSHANDAAWCAAEMESSVQQLNVERQCADPSSFPIEIGVGLHFDVVAMGILGDENRHTCTTISASVNLASRLEGLTKQFGARIIASQEVIDQLTVGEAPGSGIMRRRIGATMVKGSIKKVTIYDLFQTDDRALYLYKEETKEAFQRAADGILAGTIRPPPKVESPVVRAGASFSSNGATRLLRDATASCPRAQRGGSRSSVDATIPQVRTVKASGSQSARKSAAERVKQLREAISNPNRSPRATPREQKVASPLMKALATQAHPDLAILNDAMEKYGVHDHAVDALFQYTDEEGCMLLDSK